MTTVDYAGRRFRPVDAPLDVEPTVGLYHQHGDLVWAEFSGGGVPIGRLVGTVRQGGIIDAAYCMIGAGGETVAGTCVSTPTVLADGRVRLSERWSRMDGSSGVSLIEEMME